MSMQLLLAQVTAAGEAGDAVRLRQLAVEALSRFSGSGLLELLARRADAERRLRELTQAANADREALRHLDQEELVSQLETDFALCVPALVDAAGPLETWAIPLLSALAGPYSGLLNFGLQVACKVALLALSNWAAKRTGVPAKAAAPAAATAAPTTTQATATNAATKKA